MTEDMGKKLREQRVKCNLTQRDVANAVGVTEATVSRWESGHIDNMRRDKIADLARVLRVSPLFIMGIDNEPPAPPAASEKPHRKGVKIPVLGYVRAGIPMYAEENIIDYEEISQQWARSGEYFGLRIRGDSMLPTLHDGDTIIVRKQSDVDNGDIAIVLVNGDDATVKEIHEEPDGVTLIGHNVAVYAPHFYSNRQIQELPVQIIGKVVELRRKF